MKEKDLVRKEEIRNLLIRPIGRDFLEEILLDVYKHPGEFIIIYSLLHDENPKVAWRAAWACAKISEKYPEWFSKNQINEIIQLAMQTTHSGYLRLCLSTLRNLPMPQPIPVDFLNACFDWMISPQYPVAVQAIAMKMLYSFTLIEPDLKQELRAYLENISPEDYTIGFLTSRKNILHLLKNK